VRLIAAAVLVAGTSLAAHTEQAPAAATADRSETASIERIRAALERAPKTSVTLETLVPPATFRLVIREAQHCCPLPPLGLSSFASGPVPPGGLYAFEQRQRIGPRSAPPLFLVDVMPLARAIGAGFREAQRARRRMAAEEEVHREIAAYCAVQPNQPAIQICATSPATR
jgi:hypothetical protein